MQNLITIIPKIINDKFNTIAINLLIRNNWAKILDQDLLPFVRFNKATVSSINSKRIKAGNLESMNLITTMQSNHEISLRVIVDILSSAVIFAKVWIHGISESIRLLTGINSISVIFHQVLSLKGKV